MLLISRSVLILSVSSEAAAASSLVCTGVVLGPTAGAEVAAIVNAIAPAPVATGGAIATDRRHRRHRRRRRRRNRHGPLLGNLLTQARRLGFVLGNPAAHPTSSIVVSTSEASSSFPAFTSALGGLEQLNHLEASRACSALGDRQLLLRCCARQARRTPQRLPAIPLKQFHGLGVLLGFDV